MSLPIVFHPDVQTDIEEIHRWYEEQREGLGEDFLAALDEVFDRLRVVPKAHSVIYRRNVRRASPRRFPYIVLYKVHRNRVEIIAVQHQRRDPRRWQSRL